MQNREEGIRMFQICRTMLEIVAYLEENQYTEENHDQRQIDVMQHTDPAPPASDKTTAQG